MKVKLLKKFRKEYITRNAPYWKGKIEVFDRKTGNTVTLYIDDIIKSIKKQFLSEYEINKFEKTRNRRLLIQKARAFIKARDNGNKN